MARSWGLHAVVVVCVLAVSLASLALSGVDESFGLVLGFVWMPVAAVYTVLSTLLVAILPPGRRWVALAHALALTLGTLAPLFFVGPAH